MTWYLGVVAATAALSYALVANHIRADYLEWVSYHFEDFPLVLAYLLALMMLNVIEMLVIVAMIGGLVGEPQN